MSSLRDTFSINALPTHIREDNLASAVHSVKKFDIMLVQCSMLYSLCYPKLRPLLSRKKCAKRDVLFSTIFKLERIPESFVTYSRRLSNTHSDFYSRTRRNVLPKRERFGAIFSMLCCFNRTIAQHPCRYDAAFFEVVYSEVYCVAFALLLILYNRNVVPIFARSYMIRNVIKTAIREAYFCKQLKKAGIQFNDIYDCGCWLTTYSESLYSIGSLFLKPIYAATNQGYAAKYEEAICKALSTRTAPSVYACREYCRYETKELAKLMQDHGLKSNVHCKKFKDVSKIFNVVKSFLPVAQTNDTIHFSYKSSYLLHTEFGLVFVLPAKFSTCVSIDGEKIRVVTKRFSLHFPLSLRRILEEGDCDLFVSYRYDEPYFFPMCLKSATHNPTLLVY